MTSRGPLLQVNASAARQRPQEAQKLRRHVFCRAVRDEAGHEVQNDSGAIIENGEPGANALENRENRFIENQVLKMQALVASWLVFGVLLFYTSGLGLIILTVYQQINNCHPPQWLVHLMFPISHARFKVEANGLIDLVNQNLLIIAIPWFLASLFWEALMVRCFVPASQRPLHGYRLNDAISSLSLGLMNLLMGQVLFLNWGEALFRLIYDNARVTSRFADPNDPLSFWLCFIAHDALYYVYHRASHWFSWLWTSHVVHHSSEEYNLSTALRQPSNSPFTPELLISTTGMAFIFPPELAVLQGQLGLCIQFWIHTQLVPPLPWFELIFNSPSLHRIHHARNIRALGKNYGSFFSIWDRIGGTFEDERNDAEPIHYGVIPPLNSWHPVWANLQHWHHMLFVQRFWTGWRTPFVHWTPPGGRCPKLGSRLNPYTKYDARPVTSSIQVLVLWNFLITVLIATYALFFSPSNQWLQDMFGVGASVANGIFSFGLWAVTTLGLSSVGSLEMAQDRPSLVSALRWDMIRVLAVTALGIGLLWGAACHDPWPHAALGVYAFLHSMAILMLLRKTPVWLDKPQELPETCTSNNG